jgi:hypothetical protein
MMAHEMRHQEENGSVAAIQSTAPHLTTHDREHGPHPGEHTTARLIYISGRNLGGDRCSPQNAWHSAAHHHRSTEDKQNKRFQLQQRRM